MSEGRVALRCNGFTIAERVSGKVAVESITGPEQPQCRDFRWKIEMHKKTSANKPSLVRIRGDHHPQRVLTGDGTLDWSSYDLFEIEYHGEKLTPFHLKKDDRYMYLENGDIKWSTSQPSAAKMWDFVPCGKGFSPWQCIIIGVGVPVATVGAAVGGVVAGVGAVSAGVCATACIGEMTVGAMWTLGIVAGTVSGALTGLAEVRAIYNQFETTPENIKLFVVDKV